MTEPRKSSQCTRRLDYDKFHKTGEKVDKPGDSSDQQSEYETAVSEVSEDDSDTVDEELLGEVMADQLILEEVTLSDDITDFLDEHDVPDLGGRIEDFDFANKRIEELRTQYRNVHHRLKATLGDDPYKTRYVPGFPDKIEAIKDYIKELKKAKQAVIDKEGFLKTTAEEVKTEKFRYLKKEFLCMAQELASVFNI